MSNSAVEKLQSLVKTLLQTEASYKKLAQFLNPFYKPKVQSRLEELADSIDYFSAALNNEFSQQANRTQAIVTTAEDFYTNREAIVQLNLMEKKLIQNLLDNLTSSLSETTLENLFQAYLQATLISNFWSQKSSNQNQANPFPGLSLN